MRSPDFGRRFGFSKNFPDRHALIGGHRRSTLDRRGTDAARRLIDDAKQTRVVSIGKHPQVGNHILDFLTIKKRSPPYTRYGMPLAESIRSKLRDRLLLR